MIILYSVRVNRRNVSERAAANKVSGEERKKKKTKNEKAKYSDDYEDDARRHDSV